MIIGCINWSEAGNLFLRSEPCSSAQGDHMDKGPLHSGGRELTFYEVVGEQALWKQMQLEFKHLVINKLNQCRKNCRCNNFSNVSTLVLKNNKQD